MLILTTYYFGTGRNMELIIAGVIALIVVFFVVMIYNGLIAKKNAVAFATSGIDVQFKKRYDLIPNLIESAKTYMTHERSVFERLVVLRTDAMKTGTGSEESFKLNGEISDVLKNLKVSVENYPQLRSVETFTLLQRSLNEVEEELSASRRAYNAAVNDFNNSLEQFPSKVFASMMHYEQKPYFRAADVERANVSVAQAFQR